MGCDGSGCFSGDSQVRMADGSTKMVCDLVKGDRVSTDRGTSVIVCKTMTWGTFMVYNVGHDGSSTWLTQYHPYAADYIALLDGEFRHPATKATRFVDRVYNLVTEHSAVQFAGGEFAVTYGHGLTGGLVEHSFFGTGAIIRALKRLDPVGFDSGFVDMTNFKEIRDRLNHWVVDLELKTSFERIQEIGTTFFATKRAIASRLGRLGRMMTRSLTTTSLPSEGIVA